MREDHGWHRARAAALRQRRTNRAFVMAASGMAAMGVALGLSIPEFRRASDSDEPHARLTRAVVTTSDVVLFGLCHTGGDDNCVVDGDTFWMGGEKIRVADIDAPETHPPRCPEEADLGDRATVRLRELLNAGPVTLNAADRDEDRFGRKLRVVMRGGESLGETLVNEGLACPWEGRRKPWCGVG